MIEIQPYSFHNVNSRMELTSWSEVRNEVDVEIDHLISEIVFDGSWYRSE